MAFKAIFQTFGGQEAKFIDVMTNFRLFYSKKNLTKFAGLQTLRVTRTCALNNNLIGGGYFLSRICNLRQFTYVLSTCLGMYGNIYLTFIPTTQRYLLVTIETFQEGGRG